MLAQWVHFLFRNFTNCLKVLEGLCWSHNGQTIRHPQRTYMCDKKKTRSSGGMGRGIQRKLIFMGENPPMKSIRIETKKYTNKNSMLATQHAQVRNLEKRMLAMYGQVELFRRATWHCLVKDVNRHSFTQKFHLSYFTYILLKQGDMHRDIYPHVPYRLVCVDRELRAIRMPTAGKVKS